MKGARPSEAQKASTGRTMVSSTTTAGAVVIMNAVGPKLA